VKETDRLSAMATELRKLGATVEEGQDYIRITPPAQLLADAEIDYDDHRMAMCFSLVSLLGAPVVINDPKCVAKPSLDYFRCWPPCTTKSSSHPGFSCSRPRGTRTIHAALRAFFHCQTK
jgi:5-enolpyruvylshikimate-3-phosphate synthase